jgi:hypothetical protein
MILIRLKLSNQIDESKFKNHHLNNVTFAPQTALSRWFL